MIWSIEREDRVDLKRKPILWGLDKDELFFGCFVLFVGIVKGGPELDIIPPAMSKLLLIIGILPMCIKILRTSYTKNEWFIIQQVHVWFKACKHRLKQKGIVRNGNQRCRRFCKACRTCKV